MAVIVTLGLGLAITRLIEDLFARSESFGYIGLAFAAAAALAFIVVVTREAVYVTDSGRDALVVLPLGRDGRPTGGVEQLPLTGDYVQPTGFGANGIRALPGGDLVVVSGGVLYAVDASTGVADVIEVSGRQLSGGDGLELRGRTLYVVNGYGGDEVVVLRLSGDGRSATILKALETPRPSPVAAFGPKL